MRAIRSPRGSSPNTSSESSISPALSPLREVPPSFISLSLRLGGLRGGGRSLVLAGHRRVLVRGLLDRVAHRDPAAGVAGDRALDQDQAALDVGANDLQ